MFTLLLAACSGLGPPPMEPLTAGVLEAAEGRWRTHGTDGYRVVVSVRAPRFGRAVYEIDVRGGRPVRISRDGEELRAEEAAHHDYSIAGLFELLRSDLALNAVRPEGDVPPIDMRAVFEPETGRLVRFRRTVGSARRRVLLIEVTRYEPAPSTHLAAAPG